MIKKDKKTKTPSPDTPKPKEVKETKVLSTEKEIRRRYKADRIQAKMRIVVYAVIHTSDNALISVTSSLDEGYICVGYFLRHKFAAHFKAWADIHQYDISTPEKEASLWDQYFNTVLDTNDPLNRFEVIPLSYSVYDIAALLRSASKCPLFGMPYDEPTDRSFLLRSLQSLTPPHIISPEDIDVTPDFDDSSFLTPDPHDSNDQKK